jgi:hypothetical protein
LERLDVKFGQDLDKVTLKQGYETGINTTTGNLLELSKTAFQNFSYNPSNQEELFIQ